MRFSRLILVAALSLPLSARALTDESTGTHFDDAQTVEGTAYKCVGAGVRKLLFIKAYAVTFCVEGGMPAAARSYAHGKEAGSLAEDPSFFSAVVDGNEGKLIVMKLVRDIPAERMAKAFREKLAQVLPAAKVQRLVDTIPGDAKEGQVVQIYSAGGKLNIDIAGNKRVIDDAEVARKVWYAWLGPDGASPSLKESIAAHASN